VGIGKATFLKRDLAPLAAKSGWVPVTIDCSALHGDPGTEIADRLQAETRKLGARQDDHKDFRPMVIDECPLSSS
jgi:hypothetical protein